MFLKLWYPLTQLTLILSEFLEWLLEDVKLKFEGESVNTVTVSPPPPSPQKDKLTYEQTNKTKNLKLIKPNFKIYSTYF